MGEYFALADQITELAERTRRIEDLWREQEAKVLAITSLCVAAENDPARRFSNRSIRSANCSKPSRSYKAR